MFKNRTVVILVAVVAVAALVIFVRGKDPTDSPSDITTLTATGLGPLKIGMTFTDMERVSAAKFVTGNSSDACWYTRVLEGADVPALFMMAGDKLARVDVGRGNAENPQRIKSDSGFTVGSSEADILSHYGNNVQRTPHKYVEGGSYLRVSSDSQHALVFETAGGKVTSFRAGAVPAVDYVEGCS